MKIERLLLGLFTSFLMVGCSQNDDLPNGGEEAKGKDSYISIKINADMSGSRATDGFEEGTGKENKVNHVHFFFFDDAGQAFNVPVPTTTTADGGTAVLNNIVQAGSAYNYIKATGMTETTQTGSVEKILDAVVVFKVQNSIYPSSVIAVLNWDYSEEGLSKQALMDKLIEETTAITTNDEKGFIMSNSVYKSSDWQKTLDATEISSANFAATPTDAKTDTKAVKIYVERLAVKVTATVDQTKTSNGYVNIGTDDAPIHAFKVADAPDIDGNANTDIYAKLLAWDINTTAETSYLVKHLDAAWNNTNPYSGWNDYDKSRSYFAVPATQQSYNSQFTWSDIPNEFGVADYCLENTSTTHPTNILVKAQLGTVSNSTFTPQTIYQWYSVYYTSLDDLKAAVKDAVDEQITLDVDNISITPLYDNTNPDAYLAYQVKIGVATGDYLKPGSTDKLTSEEIAAIFDGIPTAKVWTDGATYYFTKIQHYDNPQINAVIRNHAYRVSIEGVKGLGTPVYTPEGDDGEEPEPIIPEPVLPEETETYIAAKINVLSWKIVNNSVVLGQQ